MFATENESEYCPARSFHTSTVDEDPEKESKVDQGPELHQEVKSVPRAPRAGGAE